MKAKYRFVSSKANNSQCGEYENTSENVKIESQSTKKRLLDLNYDSDRKQSFALQRAATEYVIDMEDTLLASSIETHNSRSF